MNETTFSGMREAECVDLVDPPEIEWRDAAEVDTPPPARAPRLPVNGIAPSLEGKRLRYYAALLFLDTVILIGCFALVSAVYPEANRNAVTSGYLMLPIFLTLALQNGSYSLLSLTDWRRASLRMISALLISGALLNFFAFFAKMNADFSRVVFVASVFLCMIAMAGLRYAAVHFSRRDLGPTPMNKLVIQACGPEVTIPHTYKVDAALHGLVPDLGDPHALNRFAHYVKNMDQVLVSCSPETRVEWAEMLKTSGVHGEVISEYAREIGALGIIHHDAHGFSSLLVATGKLGLRARATKRLFDLGASGLALLALAPLMLVVALLVKLEDGGPVFFRQRRMGRGNRFFLILKFRSMRMDGADANGDRSATRNDVRVTRIGRFIRKTSIDELPQLINVLKGDMSLVGPRPHALGSQAGSKLFWEIDPRYWQRHVLRPGITGLAQVRGYRGATNTERDLSSRLHADLEYMAGWSLWRDIRILLATCGVLVHDRAY